MKAAAILLCALLVVGANARTGEAAMPDTATVGGRELILNGSALRSVWGFPVYQVGLFLGAPNRDASTIMQTDRAPKRVRMNMLRSVEKGKFVGTVRERMDRNLAPGEEEKFAGELDAFLGYLETGGDIEPGRVITIDYVPGEGTLLGLDGREVGRIPGDEFYHLILRLWIGRPLQASIKDGLLGTASSGD